MNQRQYENCKKVLAVVEKLPDDQCYMGVWATSMDFVQGRASSQAHILPPVEQRGVPGCGTVGCLAGWAVILLTPALAVSGDIAIMPITAPNKYGVSWEHLKNRSSMWLGELAAAGLKHDDTFSVYVANTAYELLGPEAGSKLYHTKGFREAKAEDNNEVDERTDRQFMVDTLKEAIAVYEAGVAR